MASSRVAVLGAMAANVAIAVTKFIAAGLTGSSSMLSEGIHSLVDTGDSCLLLVGLARSKRPPSSEHPFGHGKEIFFWSLIVGVLIFGVGGGISFYEGILHVLNPPPLQDAKWNYVVLACAAVFEGSSLVLSWRHFRRELRGQGLWAAVHNSKDPATLSVVAEDSAALCGLAIAAVGVFASHQLDLPWVDGAASMLIGLLLAGVALVLIRESRGLLVGEGASPQVAREIRALASAEPGVCAAGPVLSMYVGPEDVLVTFDIEIDPDLSGAELAAVVERIQQKVRQRWPRVTRLYVEAKAPAQVL